MSVHIDAIGADEFDELFSRCSNWGQWGEDDELGALNYITASRRAEAAALIREGVAASCARPLQTESSVDNPIPPILYMTSLPISDLDSPEVMGVASDFIGAECHGEVQSHIDALCHIAYRGRIYNGRPASTVGPAGGRASHLGVIETGIITRGVLFDIPALYSRPWLEPGHAIGIDELDAAERAAGVSVTTGDALLLRTGQAARRAALGPWDSANAKAGLHPRAMAWLKDREISCIGFDGDGDTMPHEVVGIAAPIHVLGIVAIGLHFFDALDLDRLAAECRDRQRASFFFAALPPRIGGATGSLVNPVAIF